MPIQSRPIAFICFSLWMSACMFAVQEASPIQVHGKQLAEFLDGLHVDSLWLPKQVVKWKSGEKIRDADDGKPHTHCSAFVAAACERKGIYILRPPEHSATMLANAQFDWLHKEGEAKGWKKVNSYERAQELANQGSMVVATYREKSETKHGHIAIVRPSLKSNKELQDEGPQIIQAGMDNYVSTSLKEGFKHHRNAFSSHSIEFFVHDIDWK